MKDLTDLNEGDILLSLQNLSKNGDYQATEYGAWFHGKHISPARVITKSYELKGQAVDRKKDLTTDTAQQRLLSLGIPIVQRQQDDGFFSKKELESFSLLVKRIVYDPYKPIDINIGQFLNQIIWEKTKIWGSKLKEKGWVVRGNKHWNKRNGSNGQAFKDYTWLRVYPKDRINDLICFTIGVHADATLVFKLDRMWQDKFFDDQKNEIFKTSIKDLGIEWQKIGLSELAQYSWNRLIDESHKFFTEQLDNYSLIADNFFSNYDRRLMRLTWNENNWEFPSGHDWKPENRGKSSVAYENQFGYGHEEWLFNRRYQLGDYQYGYIRGVSHMSAEAEVVDQIVLYTLNPKDKERYLVGEINNVIIIEGVDDEIAISEPLFLKHIDEAAEELNAVEADSQNLINGYLLPNVKFRWSDVTIFNDPIPAPYLKSASFNRFQPYKIDVELEDAINSVIADAISLVFQSGKAKTTGDYTKNISGGKKKVNRSHSQITDDLYEYLKNVKGYSPDDLSAERTRVGGAIIDFVTREKSGLRLFEAKTSSTALRNIRQALGQLFEYAFLDENAQIAGLVIVGPAELTNVESNYLNKLKKILDVQLEYWAYDRNAKQLKDRFIIQ
ncbi:hypothetical protein [Marinoscillum sp.]|uniref:hypothetical protein n=1 Tax=Marinoscillum sp. TaxID=2024838 RepID=UPI003BAA9CD2